MPRKITLNVAFDKEQLIKIRTISKDLGITKAQFIREGVDSWIRDYENCLKETGEIVEYPKE